MMATTRRTLMNSLRAYLGQNDRYCKEVIVQLSREGSVEIHFTKGRPHGMWDSPEREFNCAIDNVARQCGYVIKEVDDTKSVAVEST